MRLIIGGALVYRASFLLVSHPPSLLATASVLLICMGILLLAGLWTPIAGTLVMLAEVCFLLLGTTHVQTNILLGALGAALAGLGPGNRSIDALRYGRKRFDIGDS